MRVKGSGEVKNPGVLEAEKKSLKAKRWKEKQKEGMIDGTRT